MCPACLSVAAAYVAGAGSIGGLTTLVLRRFRRRHRDEHTDKSRVTDQRRSEVDDDPRSER